MIQLPLGRCRNCEAPVSYFARACPHCGAANLPNPVVTVAALLVVLVAGGLTALGLQAFRGKSAPRADSPPASPAPTTDTAPDYGWIVTAMAECEEEAKLKLDTMHFLIVPLTPTGMSLPGWTPKPISAVGDSAVLLTSSDALIGLRNRVLVLYEKPITFAVSDPATNTVYKWKPAVGVAALKTKEAGQTSFVLGFEIPDLAKDIEWGPTINLGKGTCYWINPMIRAGTRSG
jgi:hypothetical protein